MKAKGYLKEYEIKGEKFCFLDGVSMILDRQQFYRDRLNGEKIWNTSKPFGFHFVDDNNQKICSVSSYIKRIINNEDLGPEFMENHFRIIEIHPSIYKPYESLMQGHAQLSKSQIKWFNSQSCIRKMTIMKDMGNAVYQCGSLNKAALCLYIAGASQCQLECKKRTDAHDSVMSKLFNNISIIFLTHKKYTRARRYCMYALKLVPNYRKCRQRLEEINTIIAATKEMD